MNRPQDEPVTAPEPATLPSEHDRSRRSLLGRIVAPLVVVITALAKFGFAVFKFFGIFLAVGGYALIWGWWFAVGFVLLILVHELGHYIEARREGLDPQLPVFLPFLGAYVALRNLRRTHPEVIEELRECVKQGTVPLRDGRLIARYGLGKQEGMSVAVQSQMVRAGLELLESSPQGEEAVHPPDLAHDHSLLLNDLEWAEELAVISRGRVVASGAAAELFSTRQALSVRFGSAAERDAGIAALVAGGMPATPDRDAFCLVDGATDGADAIRLLADAGIYPAEVVMRRPSLEQVYVELTGADGEAAS